MIAAAFAGLGGALYTILNATVNPSTFR